MGLHGVQAHPARRRQRDEPVENSFHFEWILRGLDLDSIVVFSIVEEVLTRPRFAEDPEVVVPRVQAQRVPEVERDARLRCGREPVQCQRQAFEAAARVRHFFVLKHSQTSQQRLLLLHQQQVIAAMAAELLRSHVDVHALELVGHFLGPTRLDVRHLLNLRRILLESVEPFQ